jgi:DNA invertase Pin-like site-specific DNA recombinase
VNPTPGKRAVIYARVSTAQQREQHTIASQLAILPKLVEQHGYALVHEPYVDDGVSGETIAERPAMVQLLDDAERGQFDAIFVIDLDRLTRARRSLDWEIIKDTCRRQGILVITPSHVYDLAHEDHEFISDILSRISAYEKKKILRRMIRGKQEKTRQGRYIGGRKPYGYRIVDGQFVIDEEEAEVVREIFRRCAAGRGRPDPPHRTPAGPVRAPDRAGRNAGRPVRGRAAGPRGPVLVVSEARAQPSTAGTIRGRGARGVAWAVGRAASDPAVGVAEAPPHARASTARAEGG